MLLPKHFEFSLHAKLHSIYIIIWIQGILLSICLSVFMCPRTHLKIFLPGFRTLLWRFFIACAISLACHFHFRYFCFNYVWATFLLIYLLIKVLIFLNFLGRWGNETNLFCGLRFLMIKSELESAARLAAVRTENKSESLREVRLAADV